jgi:CubicO group peptidase (beta-lactamase class C family)
LLAEGGKLSLDDALSRFIPEFPRAKELTLRRLLNHTSGLSDYAGNDSMIAYLRAARAGHEEAALLEAIDAHQPLFDSAPGKKWTYSNTGYALASIVIARASGHAFRDYARARIFAPLGLIDTAVDDDADIVPHRVSGYTPAAKASAGFQHPPFAPIAFVRGCGDIRSTVPDLCRWHTALFGGKVLKPESLKQMLTPARLSDGSLPTNLPKENGNVDQYALGLWISSVGGHRKIAHGGGGIGFSTMLFTLPDRDFTAAYLVNCDDGGLDPAPSDKPLDALNQGLTRAALALT